MIRRRSPNRASFNPLRGSSSLQPGFPPTDFKSDRVSILYEVPRVCNANSGWRLAIGRTFQSSTRFLEFATRSRGPDPKTAEPVSILYEVPRVCNDDGGALNSLPQVSILYEVPRVCNLSQTSVCHSRPVGFNPLRGSSSLQPSIALRHRIGQGPVSILYEVPRVCNAGASRRPTDSRLVSILYEVPRVCNDQYLLDGN